ncbi:MAG: acyl-CoA dehydrogenase family protein [Jatrophihabitans sp.]
MTDLLYGDTETALRDSVRGLLAKELTTADLLTCYDRPATADRGLWTRLAQELGLAALLVPEEFGGYGTGAREAAVVLEELGRRVAPVPFLTSAVVATTAVVEVGDAELLTGLGAGLTTAALCLPWTTTVPDPTVRFGDAGRISGKVANVADAISSDVLLVPVQTADGCALATVDIGAQGVALSPVTSLDMTRPLADVHFDGAPARLVAEPPAAGPALDKALAVGAALLASEQLGLAEWCLETTVGYLRERYQFGRPLGSFQALKHRLADLMQETTTARAVARYAADCVATANDDLWVAASLAQAHCSGIAVHAAEECVQLHGGIGMTWEYPAHLHLKRAKADQLALGTAAQHRARLGTLVDIPATVR